MDNQKYFPHSLQKSENEKYEAEILFIWWLNQVDFFYGMTLPRKPDIPTAQNLRESTLLFRLSP